MLNRSYPWYIVKNLLKNFFMFLMPAAINRVRRTTGTGNPQLDHNIAKLAEYSRGVFDKYCRHIGQPDDDTALSNKTVVELGPGDTMATAFCFLAYGALPALSALTGLNWFWTHPKIP